jgi:hypothetical protein
VEVEQDPAVSQVGDGAPVVTVREVIVGTEVVHSRFEGNRA